MSQPASKIPAPPSAEQIDAMIRKAQARLNGPIRVCAVCDEYVMGNPRDFKLYDVSTLPPAFFERLKPPQGDLEGCPRLSKTHALLNMMCRSCSHSMQNVSRRSYYRLVRSHGPLKPSG